MRSFVAGLLLCACAVFFEMVGAALLWNSLPEPVPVFAGQAAPQVMPVSSWPATFEDMDGRTYSFAEFAGKVIVLNRWATWCPPCREEMPSLEALQAELGGEDFAVLTIASGRNPPPAIDKFFAEIGVETLPKLRDDRMALARAMGVMGLPVTVLIDREGNEVARLIGDADWASEPAKAVVRQLTAP